MTIDPRGYVVSADDTIEDVDLERDDVRVRDGWRLTNELAEELAAEGVAEARRRKIIPG